MKEYKFRAWDSLAEKMYSWTELLNQNLKNIFTIPEQCGYHLMQYTGLKDKNGTEIYEGDIVQAVFADEEEQEMKGVVVYAEAGACYMIIANNGDEWDLGYLDKIEVIGNKWEDSGLLNDNKNTESY